ncbi:transcriptional regulator, AsnC family [Rubrobacter xylanophilus DSM 9941]|uniref:siroheme decarboxylase n=1 Tax=Rubrobacter xylanophilus (strain DSM 9941 / JCM 11954 / NBRC 16129 / PRD-1) TaxID=266117 RepID=Q1AYP9_RUBXD|nr:AsnC family transcriptional regulator [Rubrobacter xylanophilus]ABG03479.1 transcriptional regulator, AsnC family [Rubrobacter xylanophilus DSM 9941]
MVSAISGSRILDGIDKEILNLIQRDLPLEREPFAAVGREVGVSGQEVIRRIEALKKGRVVRQISAIFDTRVLGYESSLVAARIPPERLSEGAKAINSHPGVSHNYERDNYFNLWYTLAVPPDSRLGLAGTVEVLHRISGAESTRILPTLKLFKIGVTLDMKEGATARKEAPAYGHADREGADRNITEEDRDAIRILQEDIPLTSRPFDLWARRVGTSWEELLERAEDLRRRKIMRRFSAVLYHRKAGFRANAMGVWKVPAERVDEVGTMFAHYQAVSHCYERPTYEDWPYNIFSMVHGRSREECEAVLDAMAAESGITERLSLYSTREYKKTRVRYFTPEMEAWERLYAGVLR